MVFPQRRTVNLRLRLVAVGFGVLSLWIGARLFYLQIIRHDYYVSLAARAQEVARPVRPHRGAIYLQDTRSGELFPAAVNKEWDTVYAVPQEIPAGKEEATVRQLAAALAGLTPERAQKLQEKFADKNLRYYVVARKVPAEAVERLKTAALAGLAFAKEEHRFYPEGELAAPVLGFVGETENGEPWGQYGLEGYWDKTLAGRVGFKAGARGALGNLIPQAGGESVPAEDGADLILTIDRNLQFKACARLAEGLKEYQAKGAALVLLDVPTGAIRAMCSLPAFNPNEYSRVDTIDVFNNRTVFTPFEPGSVFKAITMAAGLDLGLIKSETTFVDPCQRVINGHRIRNADGKCYGRQTMTQVLEQSINTGAVWVQEQIGNERFGDYVRRFGFGKKSGITLDTESAGDVSSLNKPGHIFGANASFGQGFTATPLQLALAFGALANEGRLLQPQIISEARYPGGRREKTTPDELERVVSPAAAQATLGMLTAVVENHYRRARIPHYYVAGKTGTAQIAERGRYSATRTNHTFIGLAPADRAQLVLLVKYEEPARRWAEQTALPVFRDVMEFALNYYGIPGTR
ncbi:MAG: penicillin-binding protein 2 [Candidatus Magasanikbacteria bacterium]|nr:penicillin-binding protein 2 [Candidatus Magasanikbacteria bacterium]